jgi:arsenate reductase-like glutaredoxin family protein
MSNSKELQAISDASAIAFGEWVANFDQMSKNELIQWLDKNAAEWERAINPDVKKSRLKTKLFYRFASILRNMT